MMKKMKLAGLLAAMSVSIGANAGVIDLFSTDQGKYEDTTANAADTGTLITSGVGGSIGVADATILGGNRDIFVSLLTSASPGILNASASVAGGAFNFSTDSQATGRAQIQWDGADATNAIDFTGLGGIDITDGGALSQFVLDVIFSDAGFTFEITAYSDAVNYTTVAIAANPHPVPAQTNIDFAAFALPTGSYLGGQVTVTQFGTGGDLMNLGALVADIDRLGEKTSLDLSISSATTVPEPSALALIGLGLLGMGAARRKARKQN